MSLPPISLPGGKSTSSAPADTSSSSTPATTAADTTSTTATPTSSTDTPTSTTTSPGTSTSSTPTPNSSTTTTTSPASSSSNINTSTSSISSTSSTGTTSSATPTGTSTSTTANGGTTSSPGTSATPTAITTHSTFVTTSNGVAVTVITNITVTPTATATNPNALLPSASTVHTAKPFLKNTAAVAGTFSAVGVLALIVLFWAGTALMRRRRERRFDDEADAAAAEAYKSAAGQAPYLDDDDEDFPGAGRSAYSRETAASLAQPPLMPAQGESYGMRELAPAAGYAPDVSAGAYGAAGLGAGVGANAALQRQRSQKSGGSVSPYHAYAGPGGGADWQYGGQQDPYAAAYPIPNAQPYGQAQAYGGYTDPASHQDLLASAGLAQQEQEQPSHRISSAAVAAQQRGVALARAPSQAVTVHAGADGLHRNKSITLEQGWADLGVSAPVQYAPAQSAEIQYAPAQNPYADVYDRRSSLLDPAQHPESGAHQEQHRAYFEPDADSVIPGINYLDDDDDGASVRSADHPRVLRVANE